MTETIEAVRDALDAVVDPEIPVLTIADLGVLRDVAIDGEAVVVTITPTYSGCPAMDTIRDEIVRTLADAGFPSVRIETVLLPAWTTDWMSDAGKRKLAAYGVAPPRDRDTPVLCPQCASANTRTVSAFGSTACKALLVCDACGEPFDHFKEL